MDWFVLVCIIAEEFPKPSVSVVVPLIKSSHLATPRVSIGNRVYLMVGTAADHFSLSRERERNDLWPFVQSAILSLSGVTLL